MIALFHCMPNSQCRSRSLCSAVTRRHFHTPTMIRFVDGPKRQGRELDHWQARPWDSYCALGIARMDFSNLLRRSLREIRYQNMRKLRRIRLICVGLETEAAWRIGFLRAVGPTNGTSLSDHSRKLLVF